MTAVFTNPQEIKQMMKQLIQSHIEAYFERFKDGAEMVMAITDTQSQADKIKSLLLRSSVLSDRHSMSVAVQGPPGVREDEDTFPLFGVFYVSVHTKEERAQVMNTVLVNALT